MPLFSICLPISYFMLRTLYAVVFTLVKDLYSHVYSTRSYCTT